METVLNRAEKDSDKNSLNRRLTTDEDMNLYKLREDEKAFALAKQAHFLRFVSLAPRQSSGK